MASRRNRTLKVDIVGDIRDLKKSLSQVESSTQTTSQKLTQAGTAIKAGFVAAVGAQATQAIGQTIMAASDLGESVNAVQVVFGDAADEVLDFGEGAASAVGLSSAAFNQLATNTGAMLQNLGFSASGSADMFERLAKRAADTGSVLNRDVGDVLAAVNAGLRGESDPLEQFGVKLSAAAIKSKALEEGLVGATGELDDQSKALAALSIFFEQTDKFAGDFANTSDSVANRAKIATAELENMKAAFGETLLGPATSGLQFASRAMDALAIAARTVVNPLDESARTLANLDQSVNRLRREVGGFEGQEGAAFVALLSNIPRQALDSTEVIEEFADAVGLTGSDLRNILNRSLEDLADLFGITESEAEELRTKLLGLRVGLNSASTAAGDFGDMVYGASAAIKDSGLDQMAADAAAVTKALKEAQAAERAMIDPVFALRTANDKLNEAFAERVRLQSEGASGGAINEAIQNELEAAQDLEFARQNLNEVGTDGLDILDRYAEQYAIGANAIRAYKDEVLGLRDALNGLPRSITIPTITGGGSDIRSLEEELNRRGGAVVE